MCPRPRHSEPACAATSESWAFKAVISHSLWLMTLCFTLALGTACARALSVRNVCAEPLFIHVFVCIAACRFGLHTLHHFCWLASSRAPGWRPGSWLETNVWEGPASDAPPVAVRTELHCDSTWYRPRPWGVERRAAAGAAGVRAGPPQHSGPQVYVQPCFWCVFLQCHQVESMLATQFCFGFVRSTAGSKRADKQQSWESEEIVIGIAEDVLQGSGQAALIYTATASYSRYSTVPNNQYPSRCLGRVPVGASANNAASTAYQGTSVWASSCPGQTPHSAVLAATGTATASPLKALMMTQRVAWASSDTTSG